MEGWCTGWLPPTWGIVAPCSTNSCRGQKILAILQTAPSKVTRALGCCRHSAPSLSLTLAVDSPSFSASPGTERKFAQLRSLLHCATSATYKPCSAGKRTRGRSQSRGPEPADSTTCDMPWPGSCVRSCSSGGLLPAFQDAGALSFPAGITAELWHCQWQTNSPPCSQRSRHKQLD